MAYSNNMTKLINRIERRLGTRALNLPEHLQKDKWAEVIIDESLLTFSRYFPHKIKFKFNKDTCVKKDGYYLIDEDKFPGIEILGVRDIVWDEFGGSAFSSSLSQPYGIYDMFAYNQNIGDIALMQMASNQMSLFNNGIYVDFEYPNKISLKSCTNINLINSIQEFTVDLLIKHSDNLNTIAPTKMEIFEDLVKADIAVFLYQELKYYNGLDTIYGNIDLKLEELEHQASKREEIINTLKESYVSASNENQPLMFTV